MKTLSLIMSLGLAAVTTGVFAVTPTPSADQQRLQIAREGCQKSIGFFPTPSKLICLLTAFGVSEKEIKPKALAIVFSVCHGRLLHTQAATTPKAYPTLAACLNDPDAITLINKELTAEGLPEIKVANPSVLGTSTTPEVKQ